MPSSPFFSIIIPTYNRGYILPETVESIQKQSYTNWEVVIVDDGSTDNTASVVQSIQLADNRIRYVFQENAERSVARNNGATHSKGKYLLFLDSDDAFTPDHLEELYKLIQEHSNPVGMIFSNMFYLTDDGLEAVELPLMQAGKEFEYMLLQPITPSRVCIHRDVFSVFRFDPQITIVEDLVLWVCIASQFPVYHLNKPTVLYRVHPDNSVDLSRNSYSKRYKGLKRFFTHEDYRAVSSKISSAMKSHLLAECTFNMARHFEYVRNFSAMNYMLIRSLFHKFSYRNKERLYMFLSHLPILGDWLRNRKRK